MFINNSMEYSTDLKDQDLYDFLMNAPKKFRENERIKKFQMKNGDFIHCILWNYHFYISGTDIVKILIYRFQLEGRQIANLKKFEEGIFSDLRNLKPGIDATLEGPRSDFLEFLYKNGCIRTQKKQKVFYWYSVPHDALYCDGLERDIRRENQVLSYNNYYNNSNIMSVSNSNNTNNINTNNINNNQRFIPFYSDKINQKEKKRSNSVYQKHRKTNNNEIYNLRSALFDNELNSLSRNNFNNINNINNALSNNALSNNDILKKTLFDDDNSNIISNFKRPQSGLRRLFVEEKKRDFINTNINTNNNTIKDFINNTINTNNTDNNKDNNEKRQRSNSTNSFSETPFTFSDSEYAFPFEFTNNICHSKHSKNSNPSDDSEQGFDMNSKIQFLQRTRSPK